MKTRYKILSIIVIVVVAFFAWPIPYNGICNLFDNYDPCSRISGFDIPGLDMLQYDTTFGMIDYPKEDCAVICEYKKNEN